MDQWNSHTCSPIFTLACSRFTSLRFSSIRKQGNWRAFNFLDLANRNNYSAKISPNYTDIVRTRVLVKIKRENWGQANRELFQTTMEDGPHVRTKKCRLVGIFVKSRKVDLETVPGESRTDEYVHTYFVGATTRASVQIFVRFGSFGLLTQRCVNSFYSSSQSFAEVKREAKSSTIFRFVFVGAHAAAAAPATTTTTRYRELDAHSAFREAKSNNNENVFLFYASKIHCTSIIRFSNTRVALFVIRCTALSFTPSRWRNIHISNEYSRQHLPDNWSIRLHFAILVKRSILQSTILDKIPN